MPELRDRLRSDLTVAMKQRDRPAVSVLRSALAAIENSEAVVAETVTAYRSANNEFVAGASAGLGAAEVARRVLTSDDERAVLSELHAELMASADQRAGLGQDVDELTRQSEVLAQYLAR